MASAENLRDISTTELRIRVYAFADRFDKIVEGAADSIMARTDDPAIRRHAVMWKLYAIPECHRAAFQADPLSAGVDLAALCGQLKQLLGPDGAGSDLFGPWQSIAVNASTRLDREVWELADSLTRSGEATDARRLVAQWVAENPIDEEYYARNATRSVSAELAASRGHGLGAVIGGLNETVNDLSDRLTIYADSLPREARWQAQLLVYDLLAEKEVEDLRARLDSLDGSLAMMAETVDAMPDLVEGQVGSGLQALDATVRATLAEIDRQRIATLADLRIQRLETLEAMAREREALVAGIGSERAEGIDQAAERVAGIVDDSFVRAEGLIDHVFWRAAQLLGGTFVALVIFGAIIARGLRGRVAAS